MCGAEKQTYNNTEVPEGKKTRGISFMMDLATAAERSSEVESRPNKKREHKSLGAPMRSSGGVFACTLL